MNGGDAFWMRELLQTSSAPAIYIESRLDQAVAEVCISPKCIQEHSPLRTSPSEDKENMHVSGLKRPSRDCNGQRIEALSDPGQVVLINARRHPVQKAQRARKSQGHGDMVPSDDKENAPMHHQCTHANMFANEPFGASHFKEANATGKSVGLVRSKDTEMALCLVTDASRRAHI